MKTRTIIILLMFTTLLEATPVSEGAGTCRHGITCPGMYTCCDVPPIYCCFNGVSGSGFGLGSGSSSGIFG